MFFWNSLAFLMIQRMLAIWKGKGQDSPIPRLLGVRWALSNTCMYPQSLRHAWLFFDPMDYSPPGFTVHGILQARVPVWVAISSRGSSGPISCIGEKLLYRLCRQGAGDESLCLCRASLHSVCSLWSIRVLGERTGHEVLPPGSLQPFQECERMMLVWSGGAHGGATKPHRGSQGSVLEEVREGPKLNCQGHVG